MSTIKVDSQYIAHFISNVASPPVWLVGTAVFATLATKNPNAWVYLLIYAFPIIILSSLYILFLLRKGIITDLHLKKREERVKPMIAIALTTLLGTVAFAFSPAPRFLILIAAAVLIQLMGVAFLTTFWKVSLHTTTATACVIMAFWVNTFGGLLLFLLLMAVVWARMHLRYHTPAQILGGIFLAMGTVGMALTLFGSRLV